MQKLIKQISEETLDEMRDGIQDFKQFAKLFHFKDDDPSWANTCLKRTLKNLIEAECWFSDFVDQLKEYEEEKK